MANPITVVNYTTQKRAFLDIKQGRKVLTLEVEFSYALLPNPTFVERTSATLWKGPAKRSGDGFNEEWVVANYPEEYARLKEAATFTPDDREALTTNFYLDPHESP